MGTCRDGRARGFFALRRTPLHPVTLISPDGGFSDSNSGATAARTTTAPWWETFKSSRQAGTPTTCGRPRSLRPKTRARVGSPAAAARDRENTRSRMAKNVAASETLTQDLCGHATHHETANEGSFGVLQVPERERGGRMTETAEATFPSQLTAAA